MVTREEIERCYAEKLGRNYDRDEDAVPNYITEYFELFSMLEADENGQLYYACTDFFKDLEREYATMDEILQHIRKLLDADITRLQKLREI